MNAGNEQQWLWKPFNAHLAQRTSFSLRFQQRWLTQKNKSLWANTPGKDIAL